MTPRGVHQVDRQQYSRDGKLNSEAKKTRRKVKKEALNYLYKYPIVSLILNS